MRPYVYIYPAKPKIRFSREELRQIGIAVALLTTAFTIVLTNPLFSRTYAGELGINFLIAILAVLTGFLLHELAHKVLAQRYGCWAEFRASLQGLLLAVLISFTGFLFAAPGAVFISGNVSPERNGKIGAVGPGTNMAVGGSITIALFLGGPSFANLDLPYLVYGILYSVGFVNLFLGVFNLIPVPPLDGSKVFAWSVPVWIAMILGMVSLIALSFSLQYL